MKNAHAKSSKEATCNIRKQSNNSKYSKTGKYFRWDRQTYTQTDRHFCIAVLGLWEANKPPKKFLPRLEKITDGNRYGIICPEFFGHKDGVYGKSDKNLHDFKNYERVNN